MQAWCGRSRPGQTARLTFSAKISPVYRRMPRGGHPQDDYMSLSVCNARVWLGRLVDPSSGDRCEGKEGAYGGRLAPLEPGMCADSGLPMRGANVVRKRSVTNPGDPAGAAGAVSGGPADGEGSVPLAGGSAAGDGS